VAIAVICPDLTPQSRYTQSIGLWGPMVFSPTAYALTFNNGDVGEGFVHWIVGAGKAAEIRLHVLSDRNNVVKGSPRLSASRERDGSTIEIYEFPPHPAGGQRGRSARSTSNKCRARRSCLGESDTSQSGRLDNAARSQTLDPLSTGVWFNLERGSVSGPKTLFTSGIAAARMERLWSLAVATSGSRWQIRGAENRKIEQNR